MGESITSVAEVKHLFDFMKLQLHTAHCIKNDSVSLTLFHAHLNIVLSNSASVNFFPSGAILQRRKNYI